MMCWATQVAADTVNVSIEGINDTLAGNARKVMSLTENHKKPWSSQKIRRLYRLAPGEIKKALQPYGYFNPNVSASLKPPKKGSKTWHAKFNIHHGPATQIASLKLAVNGPGRYQPSIRKVLHDTKLKTGERLVQSEYKSTKNALESAARSAGYLSAHFSQSTIRVNPKQNQADIRLVLDTGPRYYFGHVKFKQSVLRDNFVRRFVPFKPGEPFSDSKLIKLQLKLAKTNYYSTVDVSAERDKPTLTSGEPSWFHQMIFGNNPLRPAHSELRVPVVVHAKPSPPVHYRISAGYGTNTGPRTDQGLDLRHINGYGHSFHLNLRLSQIKQQLHFSYDIPIRQVNSDKLSFTGDIANTKYGDITAFSYGAAAQRDVGWKYGRRHAALHFLRSTYNLHDGAGNRTEDLLYPEYHLSFKRANKSLNPTRGLSASIDIRGGSSSLLSATNFVRGDIQAKAIYPLASWVDALVRGHFGALGASDFAKLPPSQRFFAGGEHSVRGYGYQSISPTNGNRVDVGGKFLATASVETDYWVYGNFGFATFFDIGDAANSLKFHFKRGVGAGFRWASPVGMVAIDFTHPLNGNRFPVSFGISIGPQL